MKNKLLLLCLLVICWGTMEAQSDDNVPLPKSFQEKQSTSRDSKVRLLAGGYFGFQIGGNTAVEVNPHIAILPWDFLCIGVGGTYMFSRTSSYWGEQRSHVFGANGFIEGLIWKQRIIAHAEYEYLNLPYYNNERLHSHGILLGPGYNQFISDNMSCYVLFLFPVWSTVDAYSIPIIRLGFNVQF